MSYEMIVGRKYHKLAESIGSSRAVKAFYDPSTDQWYEAKSWSQRGRMCTATASAKYAAMAYLATRS